MDVDLFWPKILHLLKACWLFLKPNIWAIATLIFAIQNFRLKKKLLFKDEVFNSFLTLKPTILECKKLIIDTLRNYNDGGPDFWLKKHHQEFLKLNHLLQKLSLFLNLKNYNNLYQAKKLIDEIIQFTYIDTSISCDLLKFYNEEEFGIPRTLLNKLEQFLDLLEAIFPELDKLETEIRKKFKVF